MGSVGDLRVVGAEDALHHRGVRDREQCEAREHARDVPHDDRSARLAEDDDRLLKASRFALQPTKPTSLQQRSPRTSS
ncbi:hypothetical protein OAO87_04010 [bacterium]|nr:hypothetical protein [bacterium]